MSNKKENVPQQAHHIIPVEALKIYERDIQRLSLCHAITKTQHK